MSTRAAKTPKHVKARSRNRRQHLEEVIDDELKLNGMKSPALNRSIENAFMERSFDSSMFAAKSLLNLNTEPTYDSPNSSTFTSQRDSSIFEIFKTINNENESNSPYKESGLMMKDIFSLAKRSIDLELYDDVLKWQLIGGGRQTRIHNSQVYFDKIFAIEPKPLVQKRSNTQRSSEAKEPEPAVSQVDGLYNTDGFIVHTFVKAKPNHFEQKEIVFEHPHRLTCNQWIKKLRDKLPTKALNKEVLIFINPHSGEKKSRSVFNFQIQPVLQLANITCTIVEFHDQQPLRDHFYEQNLQNTKFYGIIILGGDGSVSSVINLIIEVEAKKEENMHINEISQLSKKLRTPLCIISTGSTNQIANSIYGTTNTVTPLMYLLYGIKMKVDICTAFTGANKLQSFGFTYSCGFSTTMLRYMKRYNKLGTNKVLNSIAKGASKTKQRTIEVSIEYLLSEGDQPCDENLCFRDCKTCAESDKFYNSLKSEQRTNSHHNDFNEILNTIEDIRPPRRTREKRKKKEEWKTIQGAYIYIALLSNSSKWSHIAPGGLSKYAHLGDGFIDVILVEPTSRKDFYRFLKRHGNSKNQLNFPFVKSFRAKEVKIKILNVTSANEGDLSDSESIFFPKTRDENEDTNDDLMNSAKFTRSKSTGGRRKSAEKHDLEIQNYDSEDNVEEFEARNSREISANRESYENYLKIFNTAQKAEELTAVNKLFDENHRLNNNRFSLQNQTLTKQKPMTKFLTKKSKSIMNLFKGDKSKNSDQFDSPSVYNYNQAEEFDRKSFIGKSAFFDQNKELKRENVWNCDWNVNEITEMHLKCNRQFLKFFADGIDPETQYETSSTSCLPRL